jgi:hypothetical protein
MNIATKTEGAAALIGKTDWSKPALVVIERALAIRAGTTFAGMAFDADTPIAIDVPLLAGADYVITVRDGKVGYAARDHAPPHDDPCILGGFHVAPGGNATARAGGDAVPAINRCSLWDPAFRPACADPSGMVFIDALRAPFWADIYLLNVDHLMNGTSKLGETIADGDSPPQNPAGGTFDGLDYDTALAVMKHHGKGLLSIDEFFAAAFGVTEKTAAGNDPETTKLDAARTSKYGLMQATGNLWTWGHDGDPDTPRPSIFGGSWGAGDSAGSRRAGVGRWADNSVEILGARGRSDHLQLV